jgi:hypothetical protein
MKRRCSETRTHDCAAKHGIQFPLTWDRTKCMAACCSRQCHEDGTVLPEGKWTKAPDYASFTASAHDPNPYCADDGLHQHAYQMRDGGCRQVCLPFKWTSAAAKRGVRFGSSCWQQGCTQWTELGSEHGVLFHFFSCGSDLAGELERRATRTHGRTFRRAGAPLLFVVTVAIVGLGLASAFVGGHSPTEIYTHHPTQRPELGGAQLQAPARKHMKRHRPLGVELLTADALEAAQRSRAIDAQPCRWNPSS